VGFRINDPRQVVGHGPKTPLKSPLVQGGTPFSSNVAPPGSMRTPKKIPSPTSAHPKSSPCFLPLLQSVPMFLHGFQYLLQIQGKILGFHYQPLDFFVENQAALPPRGR
jgi:hypothetical protein